jgi:hypothetical protein
VTDPRGATGTADVEVVVAEAPVQETEPENTAPKADATAKPRYVFERGEVTLSGARSTDAETPKRLRYRWTFGDGSRARSGKTVTKRYKKPGVYDAVLTVTDPEGARNRDRVRIHVLRRVPCQQSEVLWGGSWRSRSGSNTAEGGTYCDNLGRGRGKDTLTLDFTGPRLTLGYGLARRGGEGVVFIDGKRVGVISFEGQSRAPRFVRTRTWDGLGRKRHTFRLVMRGGAGYVDDFVIAGVPRRR